MAFTTYTELKAAIATRLNRSDLTSAIVDYITLAEKRINRLVKLAAQETEAALTATVGSRALALPSLFGEPIALYLTTYLPRSEIQYRLPKDIQVLNTNGPASAWTIDGSQISTDAPADIAYTYTLRYRAIYDIASTETNALLTNYPDLYFYGALIEAADHIKNDRSMARYAEMFKEALDECLNNENKHRKLAMLTTELAPASRTNIITGV